MPGRAQRLQRMRFIARFLGLIFATFAIVFVVSANGAGALIYK